MPTFEDPNTHMESAYEDVRAFSCHKDRLADVNIVVLAAYASRDKDDEPRGEAIGSIARPVLGKIRITSLEDRVAGNADVRLLLHGDRWGQLSSAMQRAVIDDCLTMIEVLQEDGAPKRDDAGRPKLRKRDFDFVHSGFHDVAKRHGASSVEVHNLRVLFDEHGQTYLPHFDPDDRPVDFMRIRPERTGTRTKAISGKAAVGHERGSLGIKPLCDRIEHLDGAATILAVAKLELQRKPRPKVVSALKNRVLALTILPDYIAIEKGLETSVAPDLNAGVLVTMPARPKLDALDRLVPGCADPLVLGWVLDDERDSDDPRQEVIDVVESRITELRESSPRYDA